MQTIARALLVGLVAVVSLATLDPRSPAAPASPPGRTIYLAGKLSDEALLGLGAAVAAQPGAMLLLDSVKLSPYLKHFLTAYNPQRVVPVGDFPEGQVGLSRRLGVAVEPVIPWPSSTRTCPLWLDELPRPSRVVVCPAEPRSQLLRAAVLAGLEKAPLWVYREGDVASKLGRYLGELGVHEVVQVGTARLPAGLKKTRLRNEAAVEAACRRGVLGDVAVVTNPSDTDKGLGGMSALAPWLAVSKGAALLLTGEQGRDVAARVESAGLARLDALILLGNLKALPTWQRPNPIPADKDKVIDLEPLTPTTQSGLPVSYAVGRLFHDDRAVVPLMLARQRLVVENPGPRRALVASNPGSSLPMLEAFSRTTAKELANAGYEVTQRYGSELDGAVLREQMPRHDVILWEGHHNTLVKEWGFTTWDEPLPFSFVVLQSCLALMPEKVEPLLSRGALGVVGTSTRTYSASGGAISLAYFDALLYEGQSLGGSLRQAKNFLLAYAALKEKRLAGQASRTGANHRAAWAFSLWGDPTYRLPQPAKKANSLPQVRHEIEGDEVVLRLPAERQGEVTSDRYLVRMPANGRLAGLVTRTERRSVVPLAFAEVRLPKIKVGATPRLRTRASAGSWVFLWDARRQTGWLLAVPRPGQREIRFRVEWTAMRVAGRAG